MSSSPDQVRPKITIWTGADGTTPVVLDHLVVAIHVSRRLDAVVGQWELTLSPRQDPQSSGPSSLHRLQQLYGDLRCNQVVSLGKTRAGGLLMGLVSSYQRSVQVSDGGVRWTLTLRGTCLGKALASDNIILSALKVPSTADFIQKITDAWGPDHPLAAYVRGVWGPKTGKEDDPSFTFRAATLLDVATFAIERVPTLRLPVLAAVFGGEGEAGDWLQPFVSAWNDGRIWSEGLSNYQGNLLQFLRSMLDPDLYEIRIDYLPSDSLGVSVGADDRVAQPFLIIRPRPYDEPVLERVPVTDAADMPITWPTLRTWVTGEEHHRIELAQVRGYTLGCSDDEAFSHYSVSSQFALPGNVDTGDEGLAYPLVDLYTGKLHGLRSYRATLNLVGGDVIGKSNGEADATEAWDDVRRTRNRFFQWYWMNPRFERGSVTVVGNDDFRPGDPVFLPWAPPPLSARDPLFEPGMRYYCVGVDSSWSLGGEYTSTLQLVRGHNDWLVEAEKLAVVKAAPLSNPSNLADT